MTQDCSRKQFEEIFGAPGLQVLDRIRSHSPRLCNHIERYIAGDLYQDETLDIKTRELCVIACLAAQGGLTEQLVVHIRTALRHGVSEQEIVSVIEAIGTYAGVPRALNALFAAIQIFSEAASAGHEK
jgi:4-carboxymuconolactone decarboxylase